MKKILFVASTFAHIKNFHLPYLKFFQSQGYVTTVMGSGTEKIPHADQVFPYPFAKKKISFQNVRLIFLLAKKFRQEKYDYISCHTTVASAVCRLALRLAHCPQTKLVYTCHGYLFDESPSWKNRFYLLVEKFCAPSCHLLLVMNQQDFSLAQTHRLGKKIEKISGMGLNLSTLPLASQGDRIKKRLSLGVEEKEILLLSVGELSPRKNHAFLIQALAKLRHPCPNLKLCIAGSGELASSLSHLAESLGLTSRVIFLGHSKEIPQLLQACDLLLSSSKIEGLPFNVMEALFYQVPVFLSQIKGHEDLVDYNPALLFSLEDTPAFLKKIQTLYESPKDLSAQIHPLSPQYTLSSALPKITELYKTL